MPTGALRALVITADLHRLARCPHGRKGAAMSDTNTTTEQNTEQVTEQPHGTEVDWKAEARKWEARAKANRDAAQELEAMKAAQMSETEKLQKRAEEAEAKVQQYEQERQHATDAAEVAKETGVPATLLSCCTTREQMEQLAAEYAKTTHVASGLPAPESRIIRNDQPKASNRDVFAELVSDNWR